MRRAVPKTVTYIVLAGLSFLILLPFAWMLISSLKTNQQLFTYPHQMVGMAPTYRQLHAFALSLIPFWSQLGQYRFLVRFDGCGYRSFLQVPLLTASPGWGLAEVGGRSSAYF